MADNSGCPEATGGILRYGTADELPHDEIPQSLGAGVNTQATKVQSRYHSLLRCIVEERGTRAIEYRRHATVPQGHRKLHTLLIAKVVPKKDKYISHYTVAVYISY